MLDTDYSALNSVNEFLEKRRKYYEKTRKTKNKRNNFHKSAKIALKSFANEVKCEYNSKSRLAKERIKNLEK